MTTTFDDAAAAPVRAPTHEAAAPARATLHDAAEAPARALTHEAAAAAPAREAAEAPVRALFARMAEAWDANDADAYAALFTEDSDYVAFDGTRQRGRAQNAASHHLLFATVLRGSRLRGEGESVRFLRADVAILHAVGAVLLPWQDDIAPRRLSRQTLVAVRREGRWQIAAFHNPRVRPVPDLRPGSPIVRLFSLWTRLRLALKGRAPRPPRPEPGPGHGGRPLAEGEPL
jgi:uncharacterized protein (TIGR02246 family)